MALENANLGVSEEVNDVDALFTSEVDGLEDLLVLCSFDEAIQNSKDLLVRCTEAAKPWQTEQLQARVLFVLLQAQFELGRHDESLEQLLEHFGAVERVPAEVLVLWAALGMEAGAADRCGKVLEQVLAAVTYQGGDDTGGYSLAGRSLGSAEYEALSRMYATQLLPSCAGGDAATNGGSSGSSSNGSGERAAAEWLDSGVCLLPEAVKKELLEELREQRQQQQEVQQQQQQRAASNGRAATSTAAQQQQSGQATSGRQGSRPGIESNVGAAGGSSKSALPLAARVGEAAGSDDGSAVESSEVIRRSIANGGGATPTCSPDARAAVGSGCWLGGYSESLGRALGGVGAGGRRQEQGPAHGGGEVGGAHMTAAASAGILAAGALVSYALYAERRPIKRYVQQAARYVQRGASDAAAMAFGAAINPQAATAARIQSRL